MCKWLTGYVLLDLALDAAILVYLYRTGRLQPLLQAAWERRWPRW